MIDFIASIVWWKWSIFFFVIYLIYGIAIRAYAEYKIPVTRHGKWSKYYHQKMQFIKETNTFLYILFEFQEIINFCMIVFPIVSLLKND